MPAIQRLLLLLFVLLVSAACGGQPFAAGVASTPVDALPVSSGNSGVYIRELPTALPPAMIDEADTEYTLLTNVYARTAPAVVNVEARIRLEGGGTDVSRGSGFVYDAQGHVATNAHVIKDAELILITFNDGFVAEAEVVGLDTFSDLGLVRVEVPDTRLQPLVVADSDLVRVGQRAIAIGNPFGLSSSMSAGIVSGLGRTLRSAELIDAEAPPGFQNPSIIQTDTPINPGNSGGPLLNSAGEVIGITTAIRTESGVFQGVGFAVPANTLRRVVPELISSGFVNYSWMGISVQSEDLGLGVAALAEPLDLPVQAGVLIQGVTIGSPADKAGLQGGGRWVDVRGTPVCLGGDIIVAIDGKFVRNMDELVSHLVLNTRPGDRVDLMVVRDRNTFEVPMILEPRPDGPREVRDCAR